MKKVLLATTAVVAFAGAAAAQDLTIGGFMQFEAAYGENYDAEDSQVQELDFGVDGRLNFDYSNSTKSGLEYGMHFELDLYQSDGVEDYLTGDSVSFNDGYVFINSALGNVSMGDAGSAGSAGNQLHTPLLVGALEVDNYSASEAELVKYSNSFVGVDFAASVDDDSNWSLGIGYSADVGGVTVDLGLTAQDEALAGSIGASAGGLSAGVNYAMEEIGATTEYVAAGVSYNMGALTIGTGAETEIRHDVVSGEIYESNYFASADYELADGLNIAVGVANLDNDSAANWNGTTVGREWVAGATVTVSF